MNKIKIFLGTIVLLIFWKKWDKESREIYDA